MEKIDEKNDDDMHQKLFDFVASKCTSVNFSLKKLGQDFFEYEIKYSNQSIEFGRQNRINLIERMTKIMEKMTISK